MKFRLRCGAWRSADCLPPSGRSRSSCSTDVPSFVPAWARAQKVQRLRRQSLKLCGTRLLVYASLALLPLAAGCEITDEGAISYRIAEMSSPDRRGEAIVLATAGEAKFGSAKEMAANTAGNSDGKKGHSSDPLLPLTLIRQEQGMPSRAIRQGDSIAIRLRHVYVNHCSAIPLNAQRVLSNFALTRPICEEAILANAFEITNGRSFPVGPAAKNDARVIFFSTDVEGGTLSGAHGQHLNLANLPIYGPITYNGGPLALVLYMIEVDAETPQVKALLSSLASFGSTIYPPASPALGILNKVGGTLLEGEQDDTDFAYSVQFDSYPDDSEDDRGDPRAAASQGHAWLEEGNYVFIREQNRQATTPWGDLVLDDNTGRLYKKATTDGNGGKITEEYKDNTYLVIQVLRNLPAKDIDQQQVVFANFRSDLENKNKVKADTIGHVAQTVELDIKHSANFDAARRSLGAIEKFCAQKDRAGEASAKIARNTFDLVNLLAPDGNNEEQRLDPKQVQLLLQRMRVVANATSSGELARYQAPVSWSANVKEEIRQSLLNCGTS